MVNKLKYYSPLRYPGGKSCIFPFISNFFYENNLIGCAYAEPYAGGAGLALRLLMEEYVSHIYINDLNPSIYAFWHTILQFPNKFCEWIETVPITIENWNKYKAIQAQYLTADYFELAQSTFFLNRTNVSGVLKGGVIGGVSQSGKYKIDARFNRTELISKIQQIATFGDRILISNYDGVDFIKKLNRKQEDILIYLDPPYFQKGSDLYMNFFKDIDHITLRDAIYKTNKRWLMSYDNHDFILNLYAKNRKIIYQLQQCPSNKLGTEVLIFDSKHSFTQSITQLRHPIILSPTASDQKNSPTTMLLYSAPSF